MARERSEEFLAAHRAATSTQGGWRSTRGPHPGLRVETLGNLGALPVGSSAIIPLLAGSEKYRRPSTTFPCRLRVKAVLTNTMATGAYPRGGRPEAKLLMERLMEKAAREMRLDP